MTLLASSCSDACIAPEGFLHRENLLKGQTDLCVCVCVVGEIEKLFDKNKMYGFRLALIGFFLFPTPFLIPEPPNRKYSNPAAH